MVGTSWTEDDLERWLEPFLERLGHKTRRRMCPALYGGADRPGRSQERSADGGARAGVTMTSCTTSSRRRLGRGAAGDGAARPSRQAGRRQRCLADRRRYRAAQEGRALGRRRCRNTLRRLGKNANCQTLVSLTLASGEVPVMVGLRLFLPESWTSDPARLDARRRAGRTSSGTDEARDRARGDRPRHRRRRALWLRAGRCRLWP